MNLIRDSFFFLIIHISCNCFSQKIPYDFSCMETDEGSSFINWGADFEKELLSTYGVKVSLDEEIQFGNESLELLKSEYKIEETGSNVNYLTSILNKLSSNIKNPRGFSYKIYIIKSEDLNAFTCGGKVFFTTKMLDFCKNNDEVAAILGHEIAHNELGHINENICRIKTAETYGDVGILTAAIGQALTTPFNQKNETHCDFYGIDLMIASSYKPCAAISLWKRMSELDPAYDAYSNFLSTHPYSGKRTICCRNHIATNYSFNCGD
jgi:predicted Zn-dependent protease